MADRNSVVTVGHPQGAPLTRWVAFALAALAFAALLLAPTTATAGPAINVSCRRAKALQGAIKRANKAGTAVIQLSPNCVYKINHPRDRVNLVDSSIVQNVPNSCDQLNPTAGCVG